MAEESAHNEVLDLIVTEIKSKITDLTLLGITTNDVAKIPVPLIKNPSVLESLPFIGVCPIGTEELPEDEATNASDAYVYPNLVIIIAEAGDNLITFGSDATLLQRYLYWRQVLLDHFSHNGEAFSSLSVAAGENIDCTVSPDVIIDLQAWNDESLYISPFQVFVTIDRDRRS